MPVSTKLQRQKFLDEIDAVSEEFWQASFSDKFNLKLRNFFRDRHKQIRKFRKTVLAIINLPNFDVAEWNVKLTDITARGNDVLKPEIFTSKDNISQAALSNVNNDNNDENRIDNSVQSNVESNSSNGSTSSSSSSSTSSSINSSNSTDADDVDNDDDTEGDSFDDAFSDAEVEIEGFTNILREPPGFSDTSDDNELVQLSSKVVNFMHLDEDEQIPDLVPVEKYDSEQASPVEKNNAVTTKLADASDKAGLEELAALENEVKDEDAIVGNLTDVSNRANAEKLAALKKEIEKDGTFIGDLVDDNDTDVLKELAVLEKENEKENAVKVNLAGVNSTMAEEPAVVNGPQAANSDKSEKLFDDAETDDEASLEAASDDENDTVALKKSPNDSDTDKETTLEPANNDENDPLISKKSLSDADTDDETTLEPGSDDENDAVASKKSLNGSDSEADADDEASLGAPSDDENDDVTSEKSFDDVDDEVSAQSSPSDDEEEEQPEKTATSMRKKSIRSRTAKTVKRALTVARNKSTSNTTATKTSTTENQTVLDEIDYYILRHLPAFIRRGEVLAAQLAQTSTTQASTDIDVEELADSAEQLSTQLQNFVTHLQQLPLHFDDKTIRELRKAQEIAGHLQEAVVFATNDNRLNEIGHFSTRVEIVSAESINDLQKKFDSRAKIFTETKVTETTEANEVNEANKANETTEATKAINTNPVDNEVRSGPIKTRDKCAPGEYAVYYTEVNNLKSISTHYATKGGAYVSKFRTNFDNASLKTLPRTTVGLFTKVSIPHDDILKMALIEMGNFKLANPNTHFPVTFTGSKEQREAMAIAAVVLELYCPQSDGITDAQMKLFYQRAKSAAFKDLPPNLLDSLKQRASQAVVVASLRS